MIGNAADDPGLFLKCLLADWNKCLEFTIFVKLILNYFKTCLQNYCCLYVIIA